jgi:exodeoxyribonuclease VII large subunit
LANPSALIDQRLSANKSLREQLHAKVTNRLQLGAAEIRGIQGTLRALSPQGTLDRGYAIARDENQNVIKTVGQVKPGEVLTIRISDGEFTVRISE